MWNFTKTLIGIKDAIDEFIRKKGQEPDYEFGQRCVNESEGKLIDTETNLDLLIKEDIHLLLEWLARTDIGEKPPVPQIEGVRRLEERRRSEEKQAKKAKSGAYISFVCGILGVLFPGSLWLMGLVALFLGIQCHRMLAKLNIKEGRGYATWAIGLGGLACLEALKRLF